MNFCDLICGHLARYKYETVGVKEDGIFLYRGRDVPKAHILPTCHRDLNILPEYRAQFFKSEFAKIKFHRYFHHLNSSQAMCINLFYPLMEERRLSLITECLSISGIESLTPCFEKESAIEQAIRRTNFDFHLKCSMAMNNDAEIFFEIKYTENGFGKVKPDVEHKKKFKETYLPLLQKSVFLNDNCREESFFLNHYQILRNLVHVAPSSYVVLLFPSANMAVKQEAIEAFQDLLTDTGRAMVKLVFLEDLVSFIEDQVPDSSLSDYYRRFRKKYLPF